MVPLQPSVPPHRWFSVIDVLVKLLDSSQRGSRVQDTKIVSFRQGGDEIHLKCSRNGVCTSFGKCSFKSVVHWLLGPWRMGQRLWRRRSRRRTRVSTGGFVLLQVFDAFSRQGGGLERLGRLVQRHQSEVLAGRVLQEGFDRGQAQDHGLWLVVLHPDPPFLDEPSFEVIEVDVPAFDVLLADRVVHEASKEMR